MNCKRKGAQREHKSIALLESQGYKCTRAAASLGAFDIIAIRSDLILLVQVKSNRWPGSEEMEQIAAFECPPNCVRVIHRWRDKESEPDVKYVYSDYVGPL